MKERILLADDETAILQTLKAILEGRHFEVDTAATAREAISKLQTSTYRMVITDMKMEAEESGYEVVRAARKAAYDPAIVILTAYPLLGGRWKKEGAQALLTKPTDADDLLRRIDRLLIPARLIATG